MLDMTENCQFCGSTACEWDGPQQLGCADCGFDAQDQLLSHADDLRRYSNEIAGPVIDAECWRLTAEAMQGITEGAVAAQAWVFKAVCLTAA